MADDLPELAVGAASQTAWRDQNAFQSILETTADKAGESFLRHLVRQLAQALGSSHAFVAEFAGSKDRVRTIGFWSDSGWLENVEYDLAGTPCSEVVRSGFCLCSDGVQDAYPRDEGLRTLGARSYMGVALAGHGGRPIGHLAVMDRSPLRLDRDGADPDPGSAAQGRLPLLRLFAERARIELERMRAEHRLHETLAALRSELEDRSVAMARSIQQLGLAYEELAALLRMNQAVSRGLDRDELFGALAANLSSLVPTDRFGIEMPMGRDQLKGHLLTPVDGVLPDRTDAHVLAAEGTACHFVLERGEAVITSSLGSSRSRSPRPST